MRRHGPLLAALGLAAAMPAIAAPNSGYFLHGYYTPTTGQVGRPFHADVSFEVDDIPANCVADWKDMEISGALPPGLNAAGATSSVIAGTPVTAGDWPVTITFHQLACTYDDKDGVDRAISVVFHIAP